MSNDITAFGSVITLIASFTFPTGIPLTEFASDGDPLDIPSIPIAEAEMGLNGNMITYSKPAPIDLSISVVVGSEDDTNLQILAEANRVGAGKSSAYDTITLNCVYPDGSVVRFTGGVIMSAMFGKSIASNGRLKTRTYSFRFENKSGA